MIAFVDREWSGEIANRLRGVGRYHASRLVVLAYEPRRERLDARVMIASDGEPAPGELALLHETVVVELGDRHLDDLLTIADPLVVTDLPTLLWSPHGHHDIVDELLALCQAVLLDSVDEPVQPRSARPRLRAQPAGLRRRPRLAAHDALARARRRQLRPAAASCRAATHRPVTVRHHPDSTAAAMLLARLARLAPRVDARAARRRRRRARRRGPSRRAATSTLRLEAAPELQVRGLEDVALETASGRRLLLGRGPGGLRARSRDAHGHEREWTIPGASRGETGVLGEGIRQALLRDPTYVPALTAARAMLPSSASGGAGPVAATRSRPA